MTMDYYGLENVLRYGVFKNRNIESFVNKYLITDKKWFQMKLVIMQIHQHKWTCRKKCQINLSIPILLLLEGQDPISKHHEINIYIYNKIVEMELDEDISFEQANI